MRITLNDEWFIDTDTTCVTLYQNKVTKAGHRTKADNIGKVREDPVGHWSNIRDAIYNYVLMSIRRADGTVDGQGLLEQMDQRIAHIEQMVQRISGTIEAPCTTPRPLVLRKPEIKPVVAATIQAVETAEPPVAKKKEESPKVVIKPVETPEPLVVSTEPAKAVRKKFRP